MRRLLIAAFAVALPLAAHAADCTPKVPATALLKAGTLTMSTNPTLPPLQYVDSSGALKGMRIELGAEIARRLCLAPEFVRVEFSAMVPGLAAGRWDMIDTGIFLTPARVKIMQMIPYENQAISLSVPDGNPGHVAAVADLKGKTLGVEIGGFEAEQANKIAAAAGATVRTFDNFGVAFQALHAGQVDAVVTIDATAKSYQDRGAFTRAISGLYPAPVALALKSKALADAVLGALDAMKRDGSYDRLFAQYGLAPFPEAFAVQGPAG